MENAVVYARYSSSNQTEQSIDGQLRVCEEYAKRNNLNIVNHYIDRAMTGTNDNRPEFLQMIEDSKKKHFKYILVYKLDRFSRNKYDNVVYKHKLAEYGVKVISATEVISDTPEGLLMEGLLEMFAEMYSRELSQKVKRGIKENLIKGKTLGGRTLYGYDVVDKKLVINEFQAQAVRLMFEEYAKGTRKAKIVEMLNNLGYRTNKNEKFTINSFQNTLTNTKYIGEYLCNGELYENYCPAIIDRKIFYKVQEQLKLNKHYKAKYKSKEDFFLTGKMFCGYCGNGMVGVSAVNKSKHKYCYYACSMQYANHSCIKRYEKKDMLEKYLAIKIKNELLQEKNIELIAEEIISFFNKNINELKIKELEKEMKHIEEGIKNLSKQLTKITNDSLIESINQQANDLSEQKNNISEQLTKIKLATKVQHSLADIKEYLRLFILGDYKDKKYQSKLVNIFVNNIIVFDDKMLIYYNFLNYIPKISFDESDEDLKEMFAYHS